MRVDPARVRAALDAVRARGDAMFVEPEGFPLLEAAGIRCPRWVLVNAAADVARLDLRAFTGDRVVVKVASSRLLHRSDVGGVAVVARDAAAVASAVDTMSARLPAEGRLGFTVNEFVAHDASLGGELLLGLRFTPDFGPVVTVGTGGIYAEFLAAHFRPGSDVAIFPVTGVDRADVEMRLRELPIVQLAAGGLRGQRARVDLARVVDAVEAFRALGRALVPDVVAELEVNPLVVAGGDLVALDVLGRVGVPGPEPWPARPLHKLAHLLRPRRVAIVGVSEAMNPGHVILSNLLREGFPADDIVVVKPGVAQIDGCRCVGDIAGIPGTVDLLVLAIAAAQVPAAVEQAIAGRKAESLIVIPGGLEEKAGTRGTLAPMYAAIRASRLTEWQGPIVNGGNCLGVRSSPGRYDTMFIPAHKMPARPAAVSPMALVTQSGAFAVAKSAKLAHLNPKYVVTVGNQMDLTVGDYLTYLAEDRELELFAVYIEGFQPHDGTRFLEAARAITGGGRTVVLYRAGRTPAGAAASASHTASIAGDYAVTRELARAAGVVVADTLEDFEDLVSLASAFRGRPIPGRRLGAVSNAGFECVVIADSLGALELAALGEGTRDRLAAILKTARIDGLVDVRNPLDLTPMANDAAYEGAVRAVLEDPHVEIGVVGCVPLTPALNTLPPGAGHRENVAAADAVAARLARLFAEIRKPWVAVVDGGPLYEPLVDRLVAAGVPTFRTADRALRLLDRLVVAAQRNACGDRAPGPRAEAPAALPR